MPQNSESALKLSDFDFVLPENLIALHPPETRDAARMLLVQGNQLADSSIAHLTDLLQPGDVLVTNDTWVIPARLRARRDKAQFEVMLHKLLHGSCWSAFARPGKKLREGDRLAFPESVEAEILSKHDNGEIELSFSIPPKHFTKWLEQHGEMPLPPYIAKKRPEAEADKDRYQTVYAKPEHSGSVAAPTAGLHLTEELFARLEQKGVLRANVTLQVGAGTFQPVKCDVVTEHKMHSEQAVLTEANAAIINEAKSKGGRVVAVGTTSLRVLESACRESGVLSPYQADTDIFIYPGYQWRCVDMLLTNFHLPKSTLFMLVCAFAGMEEMHAAYRHAIDKNYRFFSYGDASLLYRKTL